MGVTGLWALLAPTSTQIDLSSLQGKILAIDASIWLHQAALGVGNHVSSSHSNARGLLSPVDPVRSRQLVMLFRRVLKLLHYGIRPVFVFDGRTPDLKRATLDDRRVHRIQAEQSLARRKQAALLKRHAEEAVRRAEALRSGNLAPTAARQTQLDPQFRLSRPSSRAASANTSPTRSHYFASSQPPPRAASSASLESSPPPPSSSLRRRAPNSAPQSPARSSQSPHKRSLFRFFRQKKYAPSTSASMPTSPAKSSLQTAPRAPKEAFQGPQLSQRSTQAIRSPPHNQIPSSQPAIASATASTKPHASRESSKTEPVASGLSNDDYLASIDVNSSDFASLPADIRSELAASIELLRTRTQQGSAAVARAPAAAAAVAKAADAFFSAQSGGESGDDWDEDEEEAAATARHLAAVAEASRSQVDFSQAQLDRVLDKARSRSAAASPHIAAAAASSSAARSLASGFSQELANKGLEMGLARDGLSVLVKRQQSKSAPSCSAATMRLEQLQQMHFEAVPHWFTDAPASTIGVGAQQQQSPASRNLFLDATAELSAAFAGPSQSQLLPPLATSCAPTSSSSAPLKLSQKPVFSASVAKPAEPTQNSAFGSAFQDSQTNGSISTALRKAPSPQIDGSPNDYEIISIDDSPVKPAATSSTSRTPPACTERVSSCTRNVSVSSGTSDSADMIDVATAEEVDAMLALSHQYSSGPPLSPTLPSVSSCETLQSASLTIVPPPDAGTDSASASGRPAVANGEEEVEDDLLVGDATLIAIAEDFESQLSANGEYEGEPVGARKQEPGVELSGLQPTSPQSQGQSPSLILDPSQGQQQATGPEVIGELGNELCTMLHALGVPWVQSEAEADVECALLDATDLLHGIVTEDSDCWLYGARRIYKHVFAQNNTKDVSFYTSDAFGALERSFLLEETLDESVNGKSEAADQRAAFNCSRCGRSLALNRAELVFLAMLTGSDYTRGVPHVGATTARLLVRRFLRPRIRALEHTAAFCGVCNFDGTHSLPDSDDSIAAAALSPAELVVDALHDFKDWFTSAHQLLKNGDRSEYRALPSQLKTLMSQLDPHDMKDFPNAHIVRVYLQPLEFLQLQRQFCPKFAFHSFLTGGCSTDQQGTSASTSPDIVAYMRDREETLRWSMPDTKALTNYAERAFGWPQSKLENVLHPVLRRVREWRERGLMGRGQMRERPGDEGAAAATAAPLTQLSITAFTQRVMPNSTTKADLLGSKKSSSLMPPTRSASSDTSKSPSKKSKTDSTSNAPISKEAQKSTTTAAPSAVISIGSSSNDESDSPELPPQKANRNRFSRRVRVRSSKSQSETNAGAPPPAARRTSSRRKL